MKVLIERLQEMNTATPQAINLLTDLFVKTEFKKGWILGDTPWQPTATLFYISDGLVRGTVEHQEKLYTLWVLEKGFLIPGSGFLSGKGMGEIIEFLNDTQGYALNLFRAEKLAQDNVGLYKMLLEIYEETLLGGRRRELMLRMDEAVDRISYQEYLSASLMYKTDRKIFASYLRISPRHLNRFKGGK